MSEQNTNNDTQEEITNDTENESNEQGGDESESQFDFAGELKRMESNFEQKLSKMQKAIAKEKYKERQEKKEETKEEKQQPNESLDDFDARYEAKRAEERREERLATASNKISALTSDADEAKLILRYVESFGPEGDLDEDIENAYILANKGRLKAQGTAFLKTLQSQKFAGKGSRASVAKENEGGGGNISQADKQRLINSGFKEVKKGRFESDHLVAVVNRDGTITTEKKK